MIVKRIKRNIASINGTKIYYEVAGNGFPIVLLHGFTFNNRMWDDHFLNFSHFSKVIRYDMRGFGKSGLPMEGEYSHATDLKCLFDHLNIKCANVIGFSMGGEIAIDFTLNFSLSVNKLVLVDSWLGGFTGTDGKSGFKMTNLEVEDARKIWFDHPIFETIRSKPDLFLKIQNIVADYDFWHSKKEDPGYRLSPDAINLLSKITKQVLVIIGEYDLPDYHKISNIFSENIPNSKKIILKNAGHISNIEAPNRFFNIVKNFIVQL